MAVPVASHWVRPSPMSTMRSISAVWNWLLMLCPGSSTTTFPASGFALGVGFGVGVGVAVREGRALTVGFALAAGREVTGPAGCGGRTVAGAAQALSAAAAQTSAAGRRIRWAVTLRSPRPCGAAPAATWSPTPP